MAQRSGYLGTRRIDRIARQSASVLAIWLTLVVCDMATAQTISALRDSVRSPVNNSAGDHRDEEEPERNGDKNRRSRSRNHCDDGSDDPLGSLLGKMIVGVLATPYWLPRTLADDIGWERGYFVAHPYDHDYEGYLISERFDTPEVFPWILRTRIDYASDLDRVSAVGGHVLFDTASRIGIDSEFVYRDEQLSHAANDGLWTGDFNAVLRFAQSPQLQMRSGIGFNWLADDAGNEFGFNFTYGGDWFPARPWVISSEIDWGWLGDAGLFHFRLTGGVQLRRTEIYCGYDYYDVGSVQINSLVSGVGFWY